MICNRVKEITFVSSLYEVDVLANSSKRVYSISTAERNNPLTQPRLRKQALTSVKSVISVIDLLIFFFFL